MSKSLENVIVQCLLACELLARQNLGLPREKLEFGIQSMFIDDGNPLDAATLQILCDTIGQVMRKTGLVIEFDGSYFWKGAPDAPNVPEEFLN